MLHSAELSLEAAVDPNNHMDDFLGWASGHSSRILILIHFAVPPMPCWTLYVDGVECLWNYFASCVAMVAALVLNVW